MIQPKKIFRTPTGDIGFEWTNGVRGKINIRSLRLSCPCALCVDEQTGEKILDEKTVPQDVKLLQIQSIGRYAVGLIFSDGHNSGIYSYEMLEKLAKNA